MNNNQKYWIIHRIDVDASYDHYEYIPAINIVLEVLGYKERLIYDDEPEFVDEDDELYKMSDGGIL